MAKHNKMLEKFRKRAAMTQLVVKENKKELQEFGFNFENSSDRIVNK